MKIFPLYSLRQQHSFDANFTKSRLTFFSMRLLIKICTHALFQNTLRWTFQKSYRNCESNQKAESSNQACNTDHLYYGYQCHIIIIIVRIATALK